MHASTVKLPDEATDEDKDELIEGVGKFTPKSLES